MKKIDARTVLAFEVNVPNTGKIGTIRRAVVTETADADKYT
jgi:hypothetical protein